MAGSEGWGGVEGHLPFAEMICFLYFCLISPVSFKGNLSLLEILLVGIIFFRGLNQMEGR